MQKQGKVCSGGNNVGKEEHNFVTKGGRNRNCGGKQEYEECKCSSILFLKKKKSKYSSESGYKSQNNCVSEGLPLAPKI